MCSSIELIDFMGIDSYESYEGHIRGYEHRESLITKSVEPEKAPLQTVLRLLNTGRMTEVEAEQLIQAMNPIPWTRHGIKHRCAVDPKYPTPMTPTELKEFDDRFIPGESKLDAKG